MLFILIAGALVVVVALLGLSMCRVAAISDRNTAVAITEWIATSHLADRQVTHTDRAGEQVLFDHPGASFRAAG
jgi:hypothetical protein